jgi:hypothetical protein
MTPLAQNFNAHCKTKLIHRNETGCNVEHVEWETLQYLDGSINGRIQVSLHYVPPVEFEAHYYVSSES